METSESIAKVETATLRVEDAAKILGIGRQTAYQLAREGKLPGARRLGGRIVVSRIVLERFLESGDVASNS
jgi:excisionase family DNA binding protein|tara:strand:+ start:901 stop:1113 length:213 start_codon:yes stop_codon:yes gene_type:complete